MPNLELDSSRKELVKAIVKKYPVYFEEVDPERILFLRSDAKTAKKPVNITPVKSPYNLAMKQRFVMTFYTKKLNDLNKPKIHLYVLRELMRIGEFDEGTLIPFPVQDFPEILAKFGLDWEDKEDVPDVLALEEDEEDETEGNASEKESVTEVE